MRKALVSALLLWWIVMPADAVELTAPEVHESGRQLMPQNTDSFGEGLIELLQNSIELVVPDLKEASRTCGMIVCSAMLFSMLSMFSQRVNRMTAIAGTVSIAAIMFRQTNSMITLAADTVRNLLEYGKLLCQVMTAALAGQGGVTESSGLYIGTTLFITILNFMISNLLIPMTFFFLIFSIAFGSFGNEFLKKAADMIKGIIAWSLKLLLIIFSTYMTITGVVSGATDLAALKAAKVVISSSVPVVGGILSDSSEAVLVSMRIIKNSAGVYGIFAALSIFVGPFIKIGMHYFMLKVSSILCGMLGDKRISSISDSFSDALSLLLAMVAAGCVLILVSTVCFLKGAAG